MYQYVFTSSSLLESTFSLTDSSILVALQFYSQLQITEKLITVVILQMNRLHDDPVFIQT